MWFTVSSLDQLHPMVVHFPIALLLTAPLFVLLAVLWRKASRGLALSALLLLALGTAGAWVAVCTGDAAEHAVHATGAAKAVLHQHEDLAELTATVFSILTGLFAAIVLLPLLIQKLDRPTWTRSALAAVLVLLIGGDLLIAKAAHEGGRLVHEFGTRAAVNGASAPQAQR